MTGNIADIAARAPAAPTVGGQADAVPTTSPPPDSPGLFDRLLQRFQFDQLRRRVAQAPVDRDVLHFIVSTLVSLATLREVLD